jgi:predicted nucleic acid-binding protein
MSAKAFVDTNVLVYAHDSSAGAKHERAAALVEQLWDERSGVLSTQVLQEFYVSIRRKVARPLPLDEARRLVDDYRRWELVVNDGESVVGAIDLERRYGISFWDAMIVHAAVASGAAVLYSEDLNHGQRYDEVEVRNPFRDDASAAE